MITFENTDALKLALKRAASAHHNYEQATGKADIDWPAWYAEYLNNEQMLHG